MQKPWSERHNFGRVVTTTRAAGRTYFQKPRSVCWEAMYFGLHSPIASVLIDGARDPWLQRALRESIFSLSVSSDDSRANPLGCGWVEEVRAVSPPRAALDRERALFDLGVLAAHCVTFGIEDLNPENVLLTHAGLRVVDAEVVCNDTAFVYQTGLLWYDRRHAALAGTRGLWAALGRHRFSPNTLRLLLRGYLLALEHLASLAPSLLDVCSPLRLAEAQLPVRVILQPTIRYRRWLSSRGRAADTASSASQLSEVHAWLDERELSREEVEQLERGDIPYFFRFYGEEQVRYLDTPMSSRPIDAVPGLCQISERFSSLERLLVRGRLLHRLLPVGLFELVRELADDRKSFELELARNVWLEVEDDLLLLRTAHGAYAGARKLDGADHSAHAAATHFRIA